MAFCVSMSRAWTGNGYVTTYPAQTIADFLVVSGTATKTGDQWACPAGTHLLMTVAEVNTPPDFKLDLPALGITPEMIVLVGSFGAALVLGSYMLGWAAGLGKGLIRQL